MNSKRRITVMMICTFFIGMQILTAQDYRFGKVSKEELKQTQHPNDPDADAAILYREVETRFDYSQDEGFYIRTYVYERVKIYKKEGFDWATRTININRTAGAFEKLTGLKGYTYFLEGDKVKDEKLRNDGEFDIEVNEYLDQTKFTLPNLKEGCIVEFEYTLKSPFISNIDAYRLQETIPVDKVQVKFLTPEYLNYKIHQKGWLPINLEQSANERSLSFTSKGNFQSGFGGTGRGRSQLRNVEFIENTYDIQMNNVPALKKEVFAGNINNYASSVKFELEYTNFPGSSYTSYAATWEDVSKSIYSSTVFGLELEKTSYFEDDIDALLSGISNKQEKMLRVFEFVKNKMNWNSFLGYYTNQGVRKAYKENTGNIADINLMLVAMLRYAGLDSNPVLVSTKSHGIPLFPTRNGFNYVIASVAMDGQTVLLDATNKENEVNILEPEILNWQGRLLTPDGVSSWVPLYPNTPAIESALMTVNINDDLTLEGNMQCRYTGHYALSKRENFMNVSKDEVRKEIEKNKTETEISNIQFENLEKLYEPVKLSYDFKSFTGVEAIGNKLYLSPLLFIAKEENPFKLDTRKYPIDFNYPIKDRYLLSINIPEGYSIETLPESTAFALGDGAGAFRYTISNNNDIIKISFELAINQAFIPASYYSNLKKFFELLVEKENEKVVLVKT